MLFGSRSSTHIRRRMGFKGNSSNCKSRVDPLGDELQTLCEHGQLDMAMDALSQNTPPPIHTYISLLKACHKRKALAHAKIIQAHLAQQKVELSGLLGDYLVVTLAKCGAIEDALHTSRTLPCRTVFSWTAIITACTDCGRHRDALKMYQCMLDDGVEPDHFTFVSLFKACSSIPDLEEGKKLHADARRKRYGSYAFVGNTLVSMYGKCGSIVEAENVFGGLSHRDIVSWNALLSAYIEQGKGVKALQLYREMQEEGLSPDQTTFIIALQACSTLADKEECPLVGGPCSKAIYLEIGQALFADVRKNDFDSDLLVGNALLSMHAKCGTLTETENAFVGLSQHDTISWNAMLSAYIERGKGEKALQLYTQMQVIPNQLTLVIALQACGILADKEEAVDVNGQLTKVMSLEIGLALHTDAWIKGFALDLMVGTTLVSFYGKCGTIVEAENVFGRLSQCSSASWNAMLSAYAEQGQGGKALQLYRQMHEEGVHPDQLTFTIALRVCGSLLGAVSLKIGQALHVDARRKGFASDAFVSTALINMYGKCGTIEEAENVFGCLSLPDAMSWTIMLSAYVEQGQAENALKLYRNIQEERVLLNDAALICILQACSETGSLEVCKHLHFTIVFACFDTNLSLKATLIYAYGSCASMVDAQAVFDGLPQPDVVSWNACIGGYAGQGRCLSSLQMIEKLELASIKPNEATFASALLACSHAGLVGKGLEYMNSMSKIYSITPELKHFGSMVDLLGRAGGFKRVDNFLRRMPMQADLTFWLCLLAACRIHGNVELGKVAFDNAIDLQPKEAAAYILMSNIYADTGLQECANEMENVRQKVV